MDDLTSDPWGLNPADYPENSPFAEQAKFLLHYAVLAPSSHNTQPWLFWIGRETIEVFADRLRALPVVDPHDRELVISCGCAVETLCVAARRFGFAPMVTLSPDSNDQDLLARVRLWKTGQMGPPSAQFDAILHRRTTRKSYRAEPLPEHLMATCKAHAAAAGVNFDTYESPQDRTRIAQLVVEGDRRQFDDPAFRRELAAWVHSTQFGSRDGISGHAFGMPDILAPVARFVIRTFDVGNAVAAEDEKKITEGTPALGILSTATDDNDSWVATGRALSAILLELTAAGYTASFLNQPIEVP
ncbi:MAG: nitroreductase, partial [Pseudomonadota bacterium]